MKNILTVLAVLAVFALSAQPGNPNLPTPIDGGIGLLVAAGAYFGGRKLLKKND